jgi:CRP/FNR family transcriptional regulator, nitrogen fixation regulation protein
LIVRSQRTARVDLNYCGTAVVCIRLPSCRTKEISISFAVSADLHKRTNDASGRIGDDSKGGKYMLAVNRPIPYRLATHDPRSDDPLNIMATLAITSSCRRGEEIYRQDAPAEHWYRVVAGMVRKCAMQADGRRQIVDFFVAGDFFGFCTTDRHYFSAESVINGTVVARYPRRQLETLADSDHRVARCIRELTFEAIARLQARMLVLGRMTAAEKVGLFLIEMSDRARNGGGEYGYIVLPMSRSDIADYLALSVETVCRAMTDLRQSGAIRLAGSHRVIIINHSALAAQTRNGPG